MKGLCVTVIIFSILISACTPLSITDLTHHEQNWKNNNISHYRFDLSVACFCAFSQLMPLSIEVVNGKILSMNYNNGDLVTGNEQIMFEEYKTIDALFNFTRASIATADEIHVKYDLKYGYPSNINIDFIKGAMDDELGITVQRFVPLP